MSKNISKDYHGNENVSENAYTDQEAEQQFNMPKYMKNGNVCIGVVLGVDSGGRSLDVYADGRRFPNATWVLPHFNTETGAGIDFMHSPETNGGKPVIVAIANDNAFVLGILPIESGANSEQTTQPGSVDIEYDGKRADLENDDTKITANDVMDTSVWVKSAGQIVAKASAFCKLVMDTATKVIEMVCDNFYIRTPTFKLSAGSNEQTGNSLLKINMKNNENEQLDMLTAKIGKSNMEGQPQGGISINVRSAATTPQPPFNLTVQGNINITSTINLNLYGTRINLGSGTEPIVKGNTLSQILKDMMTKFDQHMHSDPTSGTTGTPIGSQGGAIVQSQPTQPMLSIRTYTD